MITEKTQDKSDYIRVTEILSPFSGLDKVPKDILANAARRGTLVHEICESIIKNLGDFGNTSETAPYIRSFLAWWKPEQMNVLSQEDRFYCDKRLITGQIDLIIDYLGEIIVVDFKTSAKESKTWPLQGSAYKYLAEQEGIGIDKIWFLHLQRDGKPAIQIEYEYDFETFSKCIDIFNYFYGDKNGKKSA